MKSSTYVILAAVCRALFAGLTVVATLAGLVANGEARANGGAMMAGVHDRLAVDLLR